MKRGFVVLAAATLALAMSAPLPVMAVQNTEIRDPGEDPEAFWDDMDWSELSAAEQALWMVLGWSEQAWDGEASEPESESLNWQDLSLQQQAAGRLLGYSTSTWDGEETADLLFVQSASGGSLEGSILRLDGVLHTTFFSERPARVVGEMLNSEFLTYWMQGGGDSFEADPPNAALVISESGETIVLELVGLPEAVGNQLSYTVRILEGSASAEFDTAALFIDAFPTPVNGQITDSVTQAFAKAKDDDSDQQPTTVNGMITD